LAQEAHKFSKNQESMCVPTSWVTISWWVCSLTAGNDQALNLHITLCYRNILLSVSYLYVFGEGRRTRWGSKRKDICCQFQVVNCYLVSGSNTGNFVAGNELISAMLFVFPSTYSNSLRHVFYMLSTAVLVPNTFKILNSSDGLTTYTTVW